MKTLIAIPCFDEMDAGFVQSLVDLMHVGEVKTLVYSGSLVYEAREKLAYSAIKGNFDNILWLDSDIMFPQTMMLDMMAQDKDMIVAICAARRPPYDPTIYRGNIDSYENVTDYGDDIFEIDACGFAAVMTKTDLVRQMFEKYGTCFTPIKNCGEDISFCIRAKEMGYKIFADPNIPIGHIGKQIFTTKRFKNVSES